MPGRLLQESERPLDHFEEFGVAQHTGRQFDGNAQVQSRAVAEFRNVSQRTIQKRGDQLYDHVGRLGRRERMFRRNQAESRIMPTQQALGPHDLTQAQVVLRLKNQIYRIFGNRRAQAVLVKQLGGRQTVAVFAVVGNAAGKFASKNAGALGALQQGFRLISVCREHR